MDGTLFADEHTEQCVLAHRGHHGHRYWLPVVMAMKHFTWSNGLVTHSKI
eukprot:SAG11_NODE_1513_length_4767_cov_2.236718_1_plen_49_part_10